MTDISSPACRFYGVVLNYDAVYHRRELVAATSIPDALQLAAEQADAGDWDSYGEPGPTYVERFQAFDTDDEAIAYLNDRANLASDAVPYAFMGQGEQIEELQRTIEILEGHKRELQAKVESLQGALRTISEAVFVVTIEGGAVQAVSTNYTGTVPSIVVVDRDIEGAAAADLTEIDSHGRAWVSEPAMTVEADYVQVVVMAADDKRAATYPG